MLEAIQCNTTGEVLGLIPVTKAITMILEGRAYSIKGHGVYYHSPTMSIEAPRIVILSKYIDEYGRNSNMRKRAEYNDELLSRRVILERDKHTCAYCGGYGDTVDHIHPLSKGGTWRWDNVITACSKCNGKKSDYTLDELGWRLLFEPRRASAQDYKLYRREQEEVYAAFEAL